MNFHENNLPILVFDAYAGAGKTHALAKHADELARKGKKILFVQPACLLIDNTYKDEFIDRLKPNYPIRVIHSGTEIESRSVISSILQVMRSNTVGGEILLITHSAFMGLKGGRFKRNWTVIMDEVPSIDGYIALNLSDHHELLTKQLYQTRNGNGYSRLFWDQTVLLDQGEVSLSRIAKNKRQDGVSEYLQLAAQRLVSDDWEVHVRPEQYMNILKADPKTNQLGLHCVLTPRIFDNYERVLIASALFYDSILYKLWAKQGWAAFRKCNDNLYKNLRYNTHTNGSALTIKYATTKAWSKHLRDKPFIDPKTGKKDTLFDHLGAYIASHMDGQDFVWMGNKDVPDDYFKTANAVRLPNTPHGLNCYQNYHNAVIISALNPPPAHFTFMDKMGIDQEELRTYYYRNAVYQAAMRISLRNPEDDNPKRIIVMDRDTAYWLQGHFNGSTVVALDGLTQPPIIKQGRPKIHETPYERVKAWRKKQREQQREQIEEVKELNGWGNPHNQRPDLKHLPIFRSKYDSLAAATVAYHDIDDAMGQLRECHRQDVASKDSNSLTSAAVFTPAIEGIETKRGKENIAYITGIWLDNDGGELSYQEFIRIFPELRMAIMNTYSSTKEQPRWRCYIPLSDAIGIKTHDMIIMNMMQRLAEHGYYGKKFCEQYAHKLYHGFDEGKFAPQSLFYLPCQAAIASNSFFHDLKADRTVLDVQEWIYGDTRTIRLDESADDITITMSIPTLPNITRSSQQNQIDVAIQQWRNAGRGSGFISFGKLFFRLKRLGMSKTDIQQTLYQESSYGHSPKDRRNEIKGLMRYYNK